MASQTIKRTCLSVQAQATRTAVKQQPAQIATVAFPAGGGRLPMDYSSHRLHATASKEQVVVLVMGATGTGKSRLSLDLAAHFAAEVINSDKMQVYKGLDVVTNKITAEESAGVPHHLLGVVDPDDDFPASEFRRQTTCIVEYLHGRGKLPIIAGGSNSYIEALVDGDNKRFRSTYRCCFLWVDVSLPVLDLFVSERVDKMVEAGLVEEARIMFRPDGDYSRGIRRAIGVPELDEYFRAEARRAGKATRERLLKAAIDDIKANTCKLAWVQRQKIVRLARSGWAVHRLDATEAFRRRGREAAEAWERLIAGPGLEIVRSFLYGVDEVGGIGDRDRGGVGGCRIGRSSPTTLTSRRMTGAVVIAGSTRRLDSRAPPKMSAATGC